MHTRPITVQFRHSGFFLALLTVAGCQSYEPRPLDSKAHLQAWHARSLGADFVASAAERISLHAGETPVQFDASDGLTLKEGQWVALVFNPSLRVARLGLEREVAVAAEAGSWPDPTLGLGALRVGAASTRPWVISRGLEMSLPFTGRLGREMDLAQAQATSQWFSVRSTEWDLVLEVAEAWTNWSTVQLGMDATRSFLEDLAPLVQATHALAEAGEIPATEAALLEIEHVRQTSYLQDLAGQEAEQRQALLALMGLPPNHGVILHPEIAGPSQAGASHDADPAGRFDHHPGLAHLTAEYEVRERALALEIAKQWPDLSLGPTFELDEGRPRNGLNLGLGLPLWQANAEAIAGARVERERARAALEGEHERLIGHWAQLNLRVKHTSQRLEHLECTFLPLVDQQVQRASEWVVLGEGSILVLLESLSQSLAAKLDWIEVRSRQALDLHTRASLLGPTPSRL